MILFLDEAQCVRCGAQFLMFGAQFGRMLLKDGPRMGMLDVDSSWGVDCRHVDFRWAVDWHVVFFSVAREEVPRCFRGKGAPIHGALCPHERPRW